MTARTPLISAAELVGRVAAPHDDLVILDCSFELADPAQGRAQYNAGHIPGAIHLDLERDLSAARTGSNGRHPLPTRAAFAARLRALGVNAASDIVTYDQGAGMTAARCWWMLLWLGHADVRVLDGGRPAWQAAGGALQTGAPPARAAGDITPKAAQVEVVDMASVRRHLGEPGQFIVDARAPARYRGETEPLDRVPGHIPGAVNRFFQDNLDPASGRFKPAQVLAQEWRALLAGHAPADVVQQCGSGVSACHNLLAMDAAGFGRTRLYAGSWSEWSADPANPVAQG